VDTEISKAKGEISPNNQSVNEEKPPFLWIQASVFSLTFLIAAIGVPWYALAVGFEWSAIIAFILFLFATGLSITAGYHRLWSHNAYKAHWLLRLFFALFGAATVQNSILSWCTGHRRHHRYVDDNDKDPYSARRGFWFSHIGWMLRAWPSGKEDLSNVQDLTRDPIVMCQEKHNVTITWIMNLAPPLLVGFFTGDYLANLLLMGFARLVITHHTTFFINSLAHYWGRQPFSDQNTANDNGLIALFTHGEGYHNFHHHFQTDYRNGIRWFDYDPTKWLIKTCSWLGLAWDLKKVPKFKIREAQVAMQLRRAEAQIERASDAEKWQALLEQEVEAFKQCLEQWKAIRQATFEETKERLAATRRDIALSANEHVKALEKALKAQLDRLNALQLQLQMAT
jgi:stearoyl-CoA desaturase (delta-9 desaturase)